MNANSSSSRRKKMKVRLHNRYMEIERHGTSRKKKIKVDRLDLNDRRQRKHHSISNPIHEIPPVEMNVPDCINNQSEKSRQNLSENWRDVGKSLLDTSVDGFSKMQGNCCCKCNVVGASDEEVWHCPDCSTTAYYCWQCWSDVHEHIMYHKPQRWNGKCFVTFNPMTKLSIHPRVVHFAQCEKKCKQLSVIDGLGRCHRFNVEYCSCENFPSQLWRHGIWPGSPLHPQTGFSTHFMELVRCFNVDQHVSIEGICRAVSNFYFQSPGSSMMSKHTSNLLLREVAESYRYLIHSLKYYGHKLDVTLDDGIHCPPCKGNNVALSSLWKFIELAVPKFHAEAHNSSCQKRYHPRSKSGFGLTDGEGTERVWAHVRPFGGMTSVSKPEHRVDLLTDVFIRYIELLKERQGIHLVRLYERAEDVKELATEAIVKNLSNRESPPSLPEVVSAIAPPSAAELAPPMSDTEKYCILCFQLEYQTKFKGIYSADVDDAKYQQCCSNIIRIEKKMKAAEKKLKLSSSWSTTSTEYTNLLPNAVNKERMNLSAMLESEVKELAFCRTTNEAKRSGGQNRAKRLQKRKKKIIASIRKICREYNTYKSVPTLPSSSSSPPTASDIPRELKAEDALKRENVVIDDLATNVDMYRRSNEEIDIVQKEAKSILTYYERQLNALHNLFVNLTDAGQRALIYSRIVKIEKLSDNLYSHLKTLIPTYCSQQFRPRPRDVVNDSRFNDETGHEDEWLEVIASDSESDADDEICY